jgi:H+/Cl- antiporter ClcA
MRQRSTIAHWAVMFFAVLVLGTSVGVSSGLLRLLLELVQKVMLGYSESVAMSGPTGVAPLRRVLSVVAGCSVAALVWWLLRTRSKKVPSVGQAVDGESMPIWQTAVHVLLQIFIVGSGASIGREVAPREFGAMLGQRFAHIFRLGERDRRLVVAIAAGAGLAGVYTAPFAGTFFAVEILLTDVTGQTVALALGTSAISAWIGGLIGGRGAFYDMSGMGRQSGPSLCLIAFALVCGVFAGLAGTAFRFGSQWADLHKPKGAAILWMLPFVALFTGIVAIWLPQVMGNGRSVAQYAFSVSDSAAVAALPMLVGLLLAKIMLTLATIRSGASGGVLQPGIAIGATFGAILAVALGFVLPGVNVAACAVMGAASFLAASQQAPLMALFLVLELTGTPTAYFVPVGLAVAVSIMVSKGARVWFSDRLSSAVRKTDFPVV